MAGVADLLSSLFDYDSNGGSPDDFAEGEAAAQSLPEFNGDEALANNVSDVLHADTGVHATLKTLDGRLQDLRRPDGSKTNPAKTCQDIKQCYPMRASGRAACFPHSGRICCSSGVNATDGEVC